jgi:ubiquinone biosynthesis protein
VSVEAQNPPEEVIVYHDDAPEFATYQEPRHVGMVGRAIATGTQFLELLLGGGIAYIHDQSAAGKGWRLHVVFLRLILFVPWIFLDKEIVNQPFAVQFRIRLEQLGPTYIKLGQILSLREDLLPKSITQELSSHLLDRLPAMPTERYLQLVEEQLGRPLETAFRWIDPKPLGSASLAQTHRARLITHEKVVIKLLKPGVRELIITDTRLMRLGSRFLQVFLGRYQPKRIIDEFANYTLREIDLRFEADNAEVFAGNFKDKPEIRFPKIYRQVSTRDMLTMEYFHGLKPDASSVVLLTQAERDHVIHLGVGALMQMIFQDGFFHADLHPGNLMIFSDASAGFIDLGMVGRFERDMRKRVFYYFYSLINGDPENAARYLISLTYARSAEDMEQFRRAVSELYGRWLRSAGFQEFSLAQVILQSIMLAGRYHISYPSEIILMVKAMVTVEGVANILAPDLNLADSARPHVRRLLLHEFNPIGFIRDSALVVPEMMEIINRSPLILSDGLKKLENILGHQPSRRRLSGSGTMTLAGFSLLAGAVVVAYQGPWPIWAGLFLFGLVVALRRQS